MGEPKLFKLTAQDRRLAVDKLVEGAAPGSEFYLLLILSTVIVTLGVLLNSAPIVIGGIILILILSHSHSHSL